MERTYNNKGYKDAISVYVYPSVFARIEAERGQTSRSAYVSMLLEEVFGMDQEEGVANE